MTRSTMHASPPRLLGTSQTWLLFLSLLVLGAFLASCQAPVQRELAGKSGFEVLDPEPSRERSKSIKTSEEPGLSMSHIPAQRLGTWATPKYPSQVDKTKAGTRHVYLRVSFDENGRVAEINQSWRGLNQVDAYTETFRTAVEDTVKTWRIEPGRLVYYQVSPSGERQYLRTETLSETIDVKFSFEASGSVQREGH